MIKCERGRLMPPESFSSELSIFFSGSGAEAKSTLPGAGANRGAGLAGDQGRQVLGAGGTVDGGEHGLGEALQHPAVGLRKAVRLT